MLDWGEGKVPEGQQLPHPHPGSGGPLPTAGAPSLLGNFLRVRSPSPSTTPSPSPPSLPPSAKWGFTLLCLVSPAVPCSSGIQEGLDTCGLEALRGLEVGASFFNPKSRVRGGPAHPLGGLSSRREAVPPPPLKPAS